MWAEQPTVRTGDDVPTEQTIAAALRPALDARPAPVMVIDGRAADARPGATATYRLLRALDLVRAEPVCCWSASAEDAWQSLDLLLETIEAPASALLVAATAVPPYRWGSVLLTRSPATSGRPLRRPATRGALHSGGGFLDLIDAAHAQPPEEN
jgi:hypothetical protein